MLADAATSVLAVAALGGCWLFGWSWLDPVMGLAGAVLVAVWAKNLLKDTSAVLLDREMDHPVAQEIREAVELRSVARATHFADLHVWRIGRGSYACALRLVTDDGSLTPDEVRSWLSAHEEIVRTTVEVNRRS